MSPVVLVLALALLAYLAFGAKGRARRGRPFPGPRPLPVLGNALQMPRTKVWERLHEWGQIYGEWPSPIRRSLCTYVLCADALVFVLFRRFCATATNRNLDLKGGIYSISLFGTPLLIVNTAEAARELLDKKSALYSNRPLPKIIEMYVSSPSPGYN